MGYFHECPSCQKVTPLDAKPLLWFDVDRVDPEFARQLMAGAPLHALPVIGDGKDAIGSITRLPLPDRRCDDCGQDGCVDCIPNTLCASCRKDACRGAERCSDPMHCVECPT